eukprot:TRINITY_DN1658_c0_g2_i1.p1 TRINITY_DN1658_c0_g2~~TRINITY_DN1658_c0_g2_i1.p1  ORF type:complete len:988 (+),score=161.66 TRINITY_DN1658_c0_g2_i1:67-3030(+)
MCIRDSINAEYMGISIEGFIMEKRQCMVRFECTCKTAIGSIYVVGSQPEIGSWDAAKGLLMSNHLESSLVYSSPEIELNSGILEFKIVRKIGSNVQWEVTTDTKNHVADISPYSNAIIKFNEEEQGVVCINAEDRSLQRRRNRGMSFDKEEAEKFVKVIEPSGKENIIIACAYLPVVPFKQEDGKWGIRITNKPMYPMLYRIITREFKKAKWVGYCRIPEGISQQEIDEIEAVLNKNNCFPVFLDNSVQAKFFYYCEDILFPFFHNFVDPTDNFQYLSSEYWETYVSVNRKFASTIISLTSSNPLIWINDIHLLMCPVQIIRKSEYANIGIYIHSSFPAAEIYRIFPYREEILGSMLCCNILGFHIFTYARHFLIACRRILGITHKMNNGFLTLETGGRTIFVKVNHAGVDIEYQKDMMKSEEFLKEYNQLAKSCQGKHVFGSIDRIHPLSGITQKIAGYKEFLKKHPSLNIKFIQYLWNIPKEEGKESEDEEQKKVLEEISKNFSRDTFECRCGHISKEDRWALMAVSDTWVITSLRQGFSLYPLEFVSVKGILGKSSGNIILSQFSGSVSTISSSIMVNPYDTSEIAKALKACINADKLKQMAIFEKDYQKVSQSTISDWTKSWISDHIRANNRTSKTIIMSVGMGKTTRLLKMRNDFSPLNEVVKSAMAKGYQRSKNRVIILDNEGTLCPLDPHKGCEILSDKSALPEETMNILTELCADKMNTVCVVSGRNREKMKARFSKIKHLGIVSENGFYFAWNDQKGEIVFDKLMEVNDWGWRATVVSIMTSYQERTDGSRVSKKDSSLIWHYRDVDADFGIKEANELVAHLHTILEYLPLDIIHEKDYVEVRPKGVNKGTYVKKLLNDIERTKGKIDYLICIGDNNSDEEMFRVIKERRKTPGLDKNTYCITVGQKASLADYYVNDYSEVVSSLIEIVLPSVEENSNIPIQFVKQAGEDYRNKFSFTPKGEPLRAATSVHLDKFKLE